ncbi:MAG TPA: hypothetical protein VJL87_07430, partial [Bdellovibrionota bacterium]|nr:hypothetical protein [Bdellovibrionota bacterium]
ALFENIDVLLNDRLEFNIPGRSLWTTNGFGALIPPVSPLNGHNPLWVNGNSVSSQYPTYIFGFPRGFNSLFRGGEWWGSLGIRIANTVLPVPQQGILTAPNPGDLFIYPVNHPNFIGTPPNEKALGSTFVTVTAQ